VTTKEPRRTGFVTDERLFGHLSTVDFGPWVEGGLALEGPEPRRRLLDLLQASGLRDMLVNIVPSGASVEDLALVHDRDYIDRVREMSANGGGEAGEYASFGPGGFDTASLAAGAAAAAVAAVASGEVDNAYALVRPPGHHAERDRGRGYCIFANVAVAIRTAQQRGLVSRVAVVDLDVHHGNGTEQAFLGDPSVLTVSLHQDRFYPEDSGQADVTGIGAARGTNVNVPLPPGAGEGTYQAALDEIVLPALRAFAPDLIVIAAGFDAGGLDPLGRMLLSASAFGRLARRLRDASDELCRGRVVAVQEGGYSALHVPFCGLRVVEALSGRLTPVEDPFAWIDDLPGQAVTNDQRMALDCTQRTLMAGGVALDSA
jgi:acetoin utilization deacetylase AcuC-like enzyme